MLRAPRLNPRHSPKQNPRRRLRSDVRVDLTSSVQSKSSWSLPTPPGTFWVTVTFFDPQIDSVQREMTEDEVYDREGAYAFYSKLSLGGVWAWWPSEKAYEGGEAGTVEFIAAGSGYGPDILEAAADLIGRPLVLGKGWNPAIDLFNRYGGTVRPRGVFRFPEVQHPDARVGPGEFAVKTAAADAYNAGLLSAGILPRYRLDSDRYQEDHAKLAEDERR